MNRRAIVSLAARRKGIARSAVLHLDCARSAWGDVVIGSRRKGVLFRPDCGLSYCHWVLFPFGSINFVRLPVESSTAIEGLASEEDGAKKPSGSLVVGTRLQCKSN